MAVPSAYYNEIDPFAAKWLRTLIKRGLIMDGIVDTRPIQDVQADDLTEFTRCHFFAGIGGWDYALHLAAWPEDQPVWTGSCPCQPFSTAGKQKGHRDARHLWPFWEPLIAKCRPTTVFGEQVASTLGRRWLAGVRADLEEAGYAVGGADLCAASVGAPHPRQRLFWVADTNFARPQGRRLPTATQKRQSTSEQSARSCRSTGRVEHADNRTPHAHVRTGPQDPALLGGSGAWSEYELVKGWDRAARRIEPGLMPMADGIPVRVGRVRAYGNAVVPQVGAAFIRAYIDARR